MLPRVFMLAASLLLGSAANLTAAPSLKALIIDGQNNHRVWPQTTQMMKRYLEETGLFAVEVATTAAEGTDDSFHPQFADYDVVVLNYNGAEWPEETKASFQEFVSDGGGLVVVHAANNAFPEWKEFNEMIGLGGWGGRNERSGPYVYLDEGGKLVRDRSPGRGGHHGPQHPFQVVIRDDSHPVTEGMPREWLHAQDELYDLLRGPAENIQILATAYADPAKGGSGRHEPMLLTVRYGKGRIFHTPMGHADYSMQCVGFIVSLQRGAEWAATGEVTQTLIPDDFPAPDRVSQRKQ